MRSYDQYCPLALGLDLVGDRWTLLIVRELGIRPARYRDLHEALPGIATNLLAERLRSLVAAGIIEVITTPPPAAVRAYALTEWGQELYAILVRLGRWGARTLFAGSAGRRFRARYVIPVVQALYGIDADRRGLEPLTIGIRYADERVHVTLDADGVEAVIDDQERPADVVLEGTPEELLGLLAGVVEPCQAGAAFRADRNATRRFTSWASRANLHEAPAAGAPVG